MSDVVPIPVIKKKSTLPDDNTDIVGKIPSGTNEVIHMMVSQNDLSNIENSHDASVGDLFFSGKESQDTSLSYYDASLKKGTYEDVNVDIETDTDASVLVIILQCETKQCDSNINNLKWIFSDPYFTVQVCEVDLPSNIPVTKTLTKTQYIENYRMRKTLNYASNGPYLLNSEGILEPQFWWNKLPVIIVKDSSISNITNSGRSDFNHVDSDDNIIGGMKRRISISLDRAIHADLFFLCKWNDACYKYVDVDTQTAYPGNNIDHGSTLKWSVQPTSTQAIMYRPSSRDYIQKSLVTATITMSDLLNLNISQGNLLATVFVPNIIDFDIDLATTNDDYYKLSECAPSQSTQDTSNSASAFIWFSIIIMIMIFAAWFLIQLNLQQTL
jgi:hypothetical protein